MIYIPTTFPVCSTMCTPPMLSSGTQVHELLWQHRVDGHREREGTSTAATPKRFIHLSKGRVVGSGGRHRAMLRLGIPGVGRGRDRKMAEAGQEQGQTSGQTLGMGINGITLGAE